MSANEKAEIANLLGEASAAHNVYEESELGGVYDQQWSVWYAAYLVEHGIGNILGQATTPEKLAEQLKGYDLEYRAEPREEGWPVYYAARFLKD
jgi:hypothetical protein